MNIVEQIDPYEAEEYQKFVNSYEREDDMELFPNCGMPTSDCDCDPKTEGKVR